MLLLGVQKVWVDWPEAGVRLQLSPLTVGLNKKLLDEATECDLDRNKNPRRGTEKINGQKYQELVAANCLHAWEGVKDAQGNPVDCTAGAKQQFLEIEVANSFVNSQVRGLGLHLAKEAVAAGKESAGASSGSPAAG